MKKKGKPNILSFAALTAITVATWVALDVYRTFSKPAPVSVPEEILAPFSPTLDQTTILEIEGRLWATDEEARTIVPFSPTIPSPSPTPTPEPEVATEEGATLP